MDSGNQFPVNGIWQLEKKWGDSSPMNVVWAFMGVSRPYTVFAGFGEVCAAVLLIWQRTATLGAIVGVGVMSNVVMLNFCFDVPVKLYSTHRLVIAKIILMADAGRFFNVLVLNYAVVAADLHGIWRGKALRWKRLVLKSLIVCVGFAVPLMAQAWSNAKILTTPAAKRESSEDEYRSRYLLTRQGFRWINEVPFNR